MTKRREDREKRNESNPVLLPECEWPDELHWDAVACPWTYQNYEVQPPFPRAGAFSDAGLPVALFSVGTPYRAAIPMPQLYLVSLDLLRDEDHVSSSKGFSSFAFCKGRRKRQVTGSPKVDKVT